MKKLIVVLVLAPLFMATQCDDDNSDSGFETSYLIQNDSGSDLSLLTDGGFFMAIESESSLFITSTLNQVTEAIVPSDSFVFNSVRLYKMEDGNFNLVYEQDPLEDSVWVLSEPSENRFEYTLSITDALLD